MAKTPRNPVETSHCASAMKHLISRLKSQGFTHRTINDALHFGPFQMGGDALGNTVSRDKAGRRVKSIIDIDRCLRTFVAQGKLPRSSDALCIKEQILFGSIEHLISGPEPTPAERAALIRDQPSFERWVRGRIKQQARERRALNTRIRALQKAANQLQQFLDKVDGGGYDGWECSPRLPDTLTAHHFTETGHQTSWAQRDVLLWLLAALKDTAGTVSLQVSYWHGSHCNPRLAGCYHPKPPTVPADVLAKEMAELNAELDETAGWTDSNKPTPQTVLQIVAVEA
jgi:hypothetical protein